MRLAQHLAPLRRLILRKYRVNGNRVRTCRLRMLFVTRVWFLPKQSILIAFPHSKWVQSFNMDHHWGLTTWQELDAEVHGAGLFSATKGRFYCFRNFVANLILPRASIQKADPLRQSRFLAFCVEPWGGNIMAFVDLLQGNLSNHFKPLKHFKCIFRWVFWGLPAIKAYSQVEWGHSFANT